MVNAPGQQPVQHNPSDRFILPISEVFLKYGLFIKESYIFL